MIAETIKLTERQRQVYEFIRDRIDARGFGPTVREIGSAFGIRSPNGVMCHLKALERKGLIKRENNRSRAISLTEYGWSREAPIEDGIYSWRKSAEQKSSIIKIISGKVFLFGMEQAFSVKDFDGEFRKLLVAQW